MKSKAINEELIIRYFQGNINEEEQQQILRWLDESPDNEETLFVMKDIYDASLSEHLFEEAQTEIGWNKIRRELIETYIAADGRRKIKIIHWAKKIGKYAAIFFIGILACYLYNVSHNNKPDPSIIVQCEIRTGKGERVAITLPDGSKVKLNACSHLIYPSDFGKEYRKLKLTGEGYFEVQTNADIPFVVQTPKLNIKAFGTTFNVKAYEDEDIVETTLVEGMVSIETKKEQTIATLKPDQVITVPTSLITSDNNKLEYKIRTTPAANIVNLQPKFIQNKVKPIPEVVLLDNITPEIYTSWKDDRWVIQAESLESLAKKIERKYDVTIDIEGENTKKYTFSGTLRNYPLEQILDIISLNAPVQYTVKEKQVIIREEKQKKEKYEILIQLPE